MREVYILWRSDDVSHRPYILDIYADSDRAEKDMQRLSQSAGKTGYFYYLEVKEVIQ